MQGHERPFFARLALGGSIAKAQGCGQRWVFVVKKTEYTPVPELSGAGDLRESALPGGRSRERIKQCIEFCDGSGTLIACMKLVLASCHASNLSIGLRYS